MPKRMPAEQRNYLQGRVRSARRDQEISYNHEPTMPPDVKAANAKVKAWEKGNEAKRDRVNEAVGKRVTVVDEAIYSGDYAKALEAVKRFEAGK